MKLKDYIKQLNLLIKENEEALKYDVVCHGGDNITDIYNKAVQYPMIGHYDKDTGMFVEDVNIEEHNKYYVPVSINSVAIN